MPEKFRNQVRFQNGQLIDLAILKPGFELARPFQNQGRFQNGQVNDLAVSKRPGIQNGQEHRYKHNTYMYRQITINKVFGSRNTYSITVLQLCLSWPH